MRAAFNGGGPWCYRSFDAHHCPRDTGRIISNCGSTVLCSPPADADLGAMIPTGPGPVVEAKKCCIGVRDGERSTGGVASTPRVVACRARRGNQLQAPSIASVHLAEKDQRFEMGRIATAWHGGQPPTPDLAVAAFSTELPAVLWVAAASADGDGLAPGVSWTV